MPLNQDKLVLAASHRLINILCQLATYYPSADELRRPGTNGRCYLSNDPKLTRDAITPNREPLSAVVEC